MVTSSTASRPPKPVRSAASPTYSSAETLSGAEVGPGPASATSPPLGRASCPVGAASSMVISFDRSRTTVTTLSLPRLVVTDSNVSTTCPPRLTTRLNRSSPAPSGGSATSTLTSSGAPSGRARATTLYVPSTALGAAATGSASSARSPPTRTMYAAPPPCMKYP